MGISKPIRIRDNFQEDVHGVQYICYDAVFAIFTDNLQERAEWVQTEGQEALAGSPPEQSRISIQPLATGRDGIRSSGSSLCRTEGLDFQQLEGGGRPWLIPPGKVKGRQALAHSCGNGAGTLLRH